MATREEINQRINDEAQAVGLELIGPGKNRYYRTYKCKTCGHEQEFQMIKIRNNGFVCEGCRIETWNKEAELAGLKRIGPGKSKEHSLYRFNSCGHVRDIAHTRVRHGGFMCRECVNDSHVADAKVAGLELLRRGRSHEYGIYRCNNCGTEQEHAYGNVRRNKFICPKCCDSQWSKPSNLYAIIIEDNGFSWIKVGVATDIIDRIRTYKLNQTAKATTKFEVLFDNRHQSLKVEKFLQSKRLKEYQLPPEQMKEYMGNGFTECYSMDAWPLVSKLFNQIIKSR